MSWRSRATINPIIRLNWLGWQTDTLTLQNHGWVIAVEKDVRTCSIRFVIKHAGYNIAGLSDMIPYEQFRAFDGGVYMRNVTIPAQYLSTRELRVRVTNFDPTRLEVIDAEPRMVDMAEYDLCRLDIFGAYQPKEILVEPENVDRLLDRILEMQSPEQKKIRERYLREKRLEEYRTKQVYAQIMSVEA